MPPTTASASLPSSAATSNAAPAIMETLECSTRMVTAPSARSSAPCSISPASPNPSAPYHFLEPHQAEPRQPSLGEQAPIRHGVRHDVLGRKGKQEGGMDQKAEWNRGGSESDKMCFEGLGEVRFVQNRRQRIMSNNRPRRKETRKDARRD